MSKRKKNKTLFKRWWKFHKQFSGINYWIPKWMYLSLIEYGARDLAFKLERDLNIYSNRSKQIRWKQVIKQYWK